jgi:hypothetical protein
MLAEAPTNSFVNETRRSAPQGARTSLSCACHDATHVRLLDQGNTRLSVGTPLVSFPRRKAHWWAEGLGVMVQRLPSAGIVNGRTINLGAKNIGKTRPETENPTTPNFQKGIQEVDDHILQFRIRPLMKGHLAHSYARNYHVQ